MNNYSLTGESYIIILTRNLEAYAVPDAKLGSVFLRSPQKISGEKIMASGKVKWFDNKKGFGFIAQESGQDVFVHHSSILGSGYKTLNEGEQVTFEIIPSDKGPKAQNVQRLQAS